MLTKDKHNNSNKDLRYSLFNFVFVYYLFNNNVLKIYIFNNNQPYI